MSDLLIVEDSALQAARLRRQLTAWGYQVRVAQNGTEALRCLDDELPRLVISDVEMPEMDGYELCSRIKSHPQRMHVPVLLFTHLSEPDDIMRGLSSGADGYLLKPYDDELLRLRVQALLEAPGQATRPEMAQEVAVELDGRRYVVTAGRSQVINMLVSTFESALLQNRQLRALNEQLTLAQRELAQKNKELAQMVERQNEFLGMAAHDLRSPLTVALGYTHFLLLERTALPEHLRGFVEAIARSSRFMVRLVEELLDLSALESGKLVLNLKPTDAGQLAERVVDLSGMLAEPKNIKLTLERDTDLPEICADPEKLEQVLNNLVSNAIKYSPEGTVVKVRLHRHGDRLIMEVQDQGPGLTQEEQGRIFQPFGRADVQSTGGEKSTGLGLTIVKKIVEGHHGTVGVESEKGKGARFVVELPLQQN